MDDVGSAFHDRQDDTRRNRLPHLARHPPSTTLLPQPQRLANCLRGRARLPDRRAAVESVQGDSPVEQATTSSEWDWGAAGPRDSSSVAPDADWAKAFWHVLRGDPRVVALNEECCTGARAETRWN